MKSEIQVSNFYVVTGGPGAGKTALLNALATQGFKIVPEDAREIIKEQIAKGGDGLPWKNKEYYTQLMVEASKNSLPIRYDLFGHGD